MNISSKPKYTTEDGLLDDSIESLLVDREGNLWIGTENGINILDNKTGKIKDKTKNMLENVVSDMHIQEIYEDSEGIFWLGTYIQGSLKG